MKTKLIPLIAVLYAVATTASAEVAVIVHPSNADSISQEDIQRLFLVKSKSFPGGEQAVPIDLEDQVGAKDEFLQKVLNRDASQIKAYWAKLVFTGKAQPPRKVDTEADMLSLISANPNMIGYVDSSKVTGAVKVVATF